jgi:Glyoxalase-like domain
MRLDHISYAVDLDAFPSTVSRLGSLLGAPFRDGGVHPRFGTRNAVLPLADGAYVEVVAPLEHPATESAPFGRAVKRRAELGGGWLGWVVGVDDLALFEKRLGRESAEGHRRRPDGKLLAWHQIGLLELIDDPQLPYLICWDCPAELHPSHGAEPFPEIQQLEIAGDRDLVLGWLGDPERDPLPELKVNWLEPADLRNAYDEAGLVAVDFRTADGQVRID